MLAIKGTSKKCKFKFLVIKFSNSIMKKVFLSLVALILLASFAAPVQHPLTCDSTLCKTGHHGHVQSGNIYKNGNLIESIMAPASVECDHVDHVGVKDGLDRCANCNRSEKGFSIYQCRGCNFIGCFKLSYVGKSSGCWTASRCPRCNKLNDYKMLGTL